MIRVELPYHLRTLAQVSGEVAVETGAEATVNRVIDSVEAQYPMLKGTIRDPATGRRRPFLRFFACGQDLSHEPLDAPLPGRVASGEETLIILGAVAGG